MSSNSQLFQPITLGDLKLNHRVVLAPLTRYRADKDHIPLVSVVKEYYSQRASEPGSLLITESVYTHPRASGVAHTPGIWSDAQINTWKEIVDAIHAKGSYIYIQLRDVGAYAQPKDLQSFDPSIPYVSASGIPLSDRPKDEPSPRALTLEEIKDHVAYFGDAAGKAVYRAGFDGVEIHGAHGLLVEQFLKSSANNRTDAYGGSVENRARFALEVVDAVVKAIGPSKTGIRLSPWSTMSDAKEENPRPVYTYLVNELKNAHSDLSYIHVVEPRVNGPVDAQVKDKSANNDFIREIWTGGNRRFISAGGFNSETATEVADTKGDLIAFGRHYIANPDLPYRLKGRIPLTPYNRETFYHHPGTTETNGYTDYPFAK